MTEPDPPRPVSGEVSDPSRPGSGEVSDRPRPVSGEVSDAARPGSGEVTARIIVNAPRERVFAAVTAWERQGEWMPMTRVRVVKGDGGEGSTIEAVTALGPAVLRDEMLVERVDEPYEVRVVHCGRLLRGPGVLRCTPLSGGRTQLAWHEWFQLPAGLAGRAAWPLLWPGSKLGLRYALRRFARLVESGALP